MNLNDYPSLPFYSKICDHQLNGVELPCGTIIHAEPADMDYKHKSTKNKTQVDGNPSYFGSGPLAETSVAEGTMKALGREMTIDGSSGDIKDVELDDFFASFE
mmetsp:Transcript_8382/g.12377  ORF Transcript_8382/g.12377 Transcript_8382/m.12377 type:complete len:103 (-) Transcript_8382:114-422(-)